MCRRASRCRSGSASRRDGLRVSGGGRVSGRILGAVLVGGASSRFGSNKAAADWRGESLAAHAAAALAPFCDAVVRVGGGDVPDQPRPGLGPLGGIAGALAHARAHGFDTVLTIACDMPDVPGELIDTLLRRAPACCADAPVLGHWPAALAGELIERLSAVAPSPRPRAGVQGSAPFPADASGPWMPKRARPDGGRKDGTLSVRRWAEAAGALPIHSPMPLANVNTPADLLAL